MDGFYLSLEGCQRGAGLARVRNINCFCCTTRAKCGWPWQSLGLSEYRQHYASIWGPTGWARESVGDRRMGVCPVGKAVSATKSTTLRWSIRVFLGLMAFAIVFLIWRVF